MKRKQRVVSAVTAVALTGVGLGFLQPTPVSAASANLTCVGRVGDNAGGLGDSAKTLGALASFTGGSAALSLGIGVNLSAPAKVTPGSGPFDVSVGLEINLPDSLIKAAVDTLKLEEIPVTDAKFSLEASGAINESISAGFASQTVNLRSAPVQVKQSIAGKLTPTKAGRVDYKLGAASFSININKSVGPISIGVLTVDCTSNDVIGNTRVQVPGAPIVAAGITVPVWSYTVGGVPLVGTDRIQPDNGNPIIPGSLRLESQAPNGGYSAVGGNAAFFLAPPPSGDYNVNYEVCGQEKFTEPEAGVNSVQTLPLPTTVPQGGLNAHPIGIKLKVGSDTTEWISLSSLAGLFGEVPTPILPDSGQLDFFQKFFSVYRAPAPATIQLALEKLPSVGAGNVKVTKAAPTAAVPQPPYMIEFVGQRGNQPQSLVEVADWNTWLPSSGLSSILAALNPPTTVPAPGQTTTTTAKPMTLPELDAALAAGTITLDKYIDGRVKLLTSDIIGGFTSPAALEQITSLFPKKPEPKAITNGKVPVPSVSTGPLCTSFTVTYQVTPNPTVLGASAIRCKRGYTAVKTTVSVRTKTRVKVNGRYVTRYVTKKVPKTVCKKVSTKKATTKK